MALRRVSDGAREGERDGTDVDGARDGDFEGESDVGTLTATHSKFETPSHVTGRYEKIDVHLSPEYPVVPVTDEEAVVQPLHVVVVGALDANAPPVHALTPPAYAQSVSRIGMPFARNEEYVPAIWLMFHHHTGADVGKSVPSGATARVGDGVGASAVHDSPA